MTAHNCDGASLGRERSLWGRSPTRRAPDSPREMTEKCDGMDLGGQTCGSQGFDMGTLACSVNCQFNTAGCSNICKPQGQPCMGPNDCCNTGCARAGRAAR